MGGQAHQVSPQPPTNHHRLPSSPPLPSSLRYVVPEGEPRPLDPEDLALLAVSGPRV